MMIAICDDNLDCIEKLESHIQCYFKNCFPENTNTVIDTFQSGIDLLKSFAQQKYDFVFLDIDMPAINGMELANQIRQFDKRVQIAFVTYMENQLPFGYKVMASGFVIKPITQDSIRSVMNDMLALMDTNMDNTLEIKLKGGGTTTLNTSNLMYIESLRHYMKAITTDGLSLAFYRKISSLEQELAAYNFVRIHRSYLINLAYVFIRNKENIRLTSGVLLPVGRSYTASFHKKYDEFRQEKGG